MKASRATPWEAVVGAAAGAIVLAPLLTTTLPYRRALVTQAVLVLTVTLILFAIGATRKRWRDRLVVSRPVLLGAALYGGAAVQGALVALVRGNDPTATAGQFLAMFLLPLAVLAGLGLYRSTDWRSFATGLVGGATAGSIAQIGVRGLADIGDPKGLHLLLPNAVSVAGVAPLALLLALALTRPEGGLRRAFGWIASTIVAVLIFGTAIRSEWLVTALGLAVFLALGLGRARFFSRPAVLAWATTVLLFGVAVLTTAWWWNRPRPNLVSGMLEFTAGDGHGTATVALPEPFVGAIRLRGTLACQGTGNVFILVRGLKAAPARGTDVVNWFNVSGTVPSDFYIVHRPQPGEERLLLSLDDPKGLGCRSILLAAEQLVPASAAVVVGRIVGLLHRPPDPGAGPSPGPFASDASIAFRMRESRAVLNEIARAPWPWLLVGQGLGATYGLQTLGYDNRGHVVPYERPNYIHNFYLFLAFKLGLLGALAVLSALTLWVWIALRGLRANAGGAADRWFFAAAASAWVTYIVWSAAAPEILDFRLAPLWGLLAATTATTLKPRDGSSGAEYECDDHGHDGPSGRQGPAPLEVSGGGM